MRATEQAPKQGYATTIQIASGKITIMAGTLDGLKKHFERLTSAGMFKLSEVHQVEVRPLGKAGEFKRRIGGAE